MKGNSQSTKISFLYKVMNVCHSSFGWTGKHDYDVNAHIFPFISSAENTLTFNVNIEMGSSLNRMYHFGENEVIYTTN